MYTFPFLLFLSLTLFLYHATDITDASYIYYHIKLHEIWVPKYSQFSPIHVFQIKIWKEKVELHTNNSRFGSHTKDITNEHITVEVS